MSMLRPRNGLVMITELEAGKIVHRWPRKRCLIVRVFGNGDNSELGLGPKQTEALQPCINPYLDPNDPSNFRVVQLACGGMHTVALTLDNKLITWGVNDLNALGRDTRWDGKLRDIDADSDDEDGELNPLESTPTEIPADHFPPGTRFVQVAAGDNCSFALTDTGLVYGWGTFRNSKGEERFGYDTLDITGNIWAWGSNEQNQFGRRLFGRHQDNLRPCQVRVCPNNAKYIASGEYHSFAVDRKDNVWAWGLNSNGQAGYPKTAGTDSAILPYPVKIPGLCGKGVTVLDGGAHHSAAVTTDGQFLVWGQIHSGQLGISFTPDQLRDPTLIRHDERDKPGICLRPTAVPNIGKAFHVACGTDHTIFVNTAGSAYATGYGFQGQLGLDSNDDVYVAQRIKGREVKDRFLSWAGAGGQFSVVAEPARIG
ncbi:regulator of chromosome condensation 1/beta-lactamase-inhibitor protein II [Phialemonium atrogriseum]|uniref:Regulator of chromosome condensation 1/beta-lactamase-inhibitor protein II n=1 Tax=Phialemonium atrogriseum TaxID=1093897 RepID=A0AAJ0FJH2_9PEZI|nr:regulator of chromosome condensation 1/beta-lactamase-inhibitor protein II [Phialemonium atrogriseum]KAK1764429.1 regulator of chromosome condensation 1/beta-lactamase-inhibitor protein II [Phialemonium atrogriseum]